MEGLVGNDLRVAAAVAGKRLTRLVKDGEAGRVREQDAVEQGHVHPLPFTRATAADERGQDALDGEEAAHGVGHGRPHESRAAVGVSRDGHEPAYRLRERVQAGLRSPRPRWPESRERAIDQAQIHRPERRVVDAELLGHAIPEGLDDHVGGGGHTVKGSTALGGGEIEAQAALVAIDGEVKNALAASRDPVHGASGIRRRARFHLDDVGAHVRQIHAADGARDQMSQFEHADSFERRGR